MRSGIQVWGITEGASERHHTIDARGHRSGIRALALSSDGALLLSAAETAVKVWNTKTFACLRHVEVNHGLCAMFAPGKGWGGGGAGRGRPPPPHPWHPFPLFTFYSFLIRTLKHI